MTTQPTETPDIDVVPFGEWPCRGEDCKGRIFGGWTRCEHGLRGRLAELEAEAASIRERFGIAVNE